MDKKTHVLIETVRNEASTNAKIDHLKAGLNPLAEKIFKMTFDPHYVYGIKKLPDYTTLPDETEVMKYSLHDALELINTLLVKNKIRGHAAVEHLESIFTHIDPEHRHIVAGVLQRDLKLGIGVKGINKARAGLLMDRHYMGAIPFEEEKAKRIVTSGEFYSQEKMDGMYVNFSLDDKKFISRNIKPVFLKIPNIDSRIREIKKEFREFTLDNVILNGELLIDGIDRYTSNGLLNSISQIEEKVLNGKRYEELKEYQKIVEDFGDYTELLKRIKLVVWDFIPEGSFKRGNWPVSYDFRFTNLTRIVKNSDFISVVPTKKLRSLDEAFKHFKEIRAQGGEGTIIKTKAGIWKSGKPIYQMKLKYELEVELRICGFRQGDPGTKYEDTLGAYIVRSDDWEIQTKSPGLTEEEREYGWTHQEERLGQIVSVKCNGISRDKDGKYSLLHPRFNGMRPDKDEADTLEDIIRADGGIIDPLPPVDNPLSSSELSDIL